MDTIKRKNLWEGSKIYREQLITVEDLEVFKADLLNEIRRLLKLDTAQQGRKEWLRSAEVRKETKEIIEPELLEELAQALKVPAEAIKNFDEEKANYYIQNNYEGANPNVTAIAAHLHHCTFNPLDN